MARMTLALITFWGGLVLAGCTTAPALQEVAPQTFRITVSHESSGGAQDLWQGLYQRAQVHCEARQRTAIALQEQGRGQGGHSDGLGLLFRCDGPPR